MKFKYTKLDGGVGEAAFSSLDHIANGPVKLDGGWKGDRINFSKEHSIYIEFRSGPEGPPGFEPSEAIEVTKEYVECAYGKKV
jgi:hypothetical protein